MFVYCETNRDCRGTKYNPNFGQNRRIQKKLVATYKQNAPNRLPRILKKTTDQLVKETRGDHSRDFWMCVTGRGSTSGPTPC